MFLRRQVRWSGIPISKSFPQFVMIYQYFGHLMQRVDTLEDSDAGRDWGQEEKGTTDDEMAGRHH